MASSIASNYSAYLQSQEFLLARYNGDFPLDIVLALNDFGAILQTAEEYALWCFQRGQFQLARIDEARCFYYTGIGKYLIIYDAEKSRKRVRFSLAHELAHIVLEHLNDEITSLSRGGLPDFIYYQMEAEANTFAGNLLAPPALIGEYEKLTGRMNADVIARAFDLSSQAAERRLSDYNLWKTAPRKKFESAIIRKFWRI